MNKPKFIEWWKIFLIWIFNYIKDEKPVKTAIGLFISILVPLSFICLSSPDKMAWLLDRGNNLTQQIVIIFIFSLIFLMAILIGIVLLLLITIFLFWIIYWAIKPWIFVGKYETLLKTLMGDKGLTIPDKEIRIKPKTIKTKATINSDKFNKIMEIIQNDD